MSEKTTMAPATGAAVSAVTQATGSSSTAANAGVAQENLAHFASLAAASLLVGEEGAGGEAPPNNNEAESGAEAGQESPPPTGEESAQQEGSPEPESGEEDLSTEDQANWTEGEKKLYGALRKEREKRKEAKAETRALREEIDALKALVRKPEQAQEQEQSTEAAAPEGSSHLPQGVLADCETPEAVEAKAIAAARTESKAMKLQTLLNRQGRDAVVEQLEAEGVKQIDGVALSEVSDDQIADFLTQVYEGARLTVVSAEPRKRYLAHQGNSFQAAIELVPELKDPKSEQSKAFQAVLKAKPGLRSEGPNWPEVVATYVLGQEAARTRRNGKAAAVPQVPTGRPVPGAPKRAPAGNARPSDYDQAAERVRNGTGSLADIQSMARAALTSGDGRAVARAGR